MWYVMLRYKAGALALTEAFATRLREVLPGDQYEVKVGGVAVSVHRRDASSAVSGAPAIMLATPGSRDLKLSRALEVAADMTKQYVAPTVPSRVRVDADTLAVWWGGPLPAEAVASLRPIMRNEVGL
jgi:hypothetical protein